MAANGYDPRFLLSPKNKPMETLFGVWAIPILGVLFTVIYHRTKREA